MATISSPRPQSPASSVRVQSPSLTPTSSVRASLDLDTNARSSSPAANPAAQRRNRAALRDYYNLKAKPVAPQQNLSRTASVTSTTSNSTITSAKTLTEPVDSTTLSSQLDDPDFDTDAYIQNLLQTSNLKTVLRAEAVLVSEIKNLDGERKALVYDNYSKLIAATQTIGNMRRSMDDAGGGSLRSLGRLGDAVEGVARTAKELNDRAAIRGATQGHRNDDVQRKTARREKENKRETVKWVLAAPERLERMLDEGKGEGAKSEWKTINGLLDKWKEVKGVRELRKACEEIMSQGAEDHGA